MRRLVANISLVVLAVLVPFGMLEAALRVGFPVVRIRSFHPIWGSISLPHLNARTTYGYIERVVTVHTDDRGLRVDPSLSQPSPTAARILALGDSFTFGNELEDDETWPSQLESVLNREPRSSPYRVSNAGVTDFGTAQELLFFRQLETHLRPQIVVLGFYVGNDILDNLCLQADSLLPRTDIPCYDLEDGRLVLTLPEKPRQLDLDSPQALLHRLRIIDFLALEARRATIWNPHFLSAAATLGLHVPPLHYNGFLASWYDDRYFKRGSNLTFLLLAKLVREVTATGGSVFILIIPDSLQVNPELQQIRLAMAPHDKVLSSFLQDTDRPQRVIFSFCSRERIHCIDPLAALRAAQRAGKVTYYPIHQHWTPLSNRIAAEAIAREIILSSIATHSSVAEK